MFPEKLLASIPAEPHAPIWWVAHHGPDKTLSNRIGTAIRDRGGTFIPYNRNRGLARSWNEGIKAGLDNGADMVILLNDDLHFRLGGFNQFVNFSAKELAKDNVGMTFVTGYETDGSWKGQTQDQGYACCAIAPRLIKHIGYFDENYRPAYYEDADYSQRIGMTGMGISIDPRCLVEHERSGTTRKDPILQAKHEQSVQGCREYFISKWGGDAGHATFHAPFNEFGPMIDFADRAAPYGPGRDRIFAAEPAIYNCPPEQMSWFRRLIGGRSKS